MAGFFAVDVCGLLEVVVDGEVLCAGVALCCARIVPDASIPDTSIVIVAVRDLCI